MNIGTQRMDTSVESIVKSLKNKAPTQSLLSNVYNKRIIHTNGAYYYRNSKNEYKILTGLVPSLKRCFWPNVNINNIMKNPKKVITKKKTTTKKKNKRKGGHFYGSIKGTKVHEQIEDFVLLDKKNFLKKHIGLHPWSKRILNHIVDKMKWIPLKSEYNIYDESLMIGTSIDMICVDLSNGKLILLEFKTGYKTYFENNDGFMEHSLYLMKNSPLNWATIQLVFSIIMLLKQVQHLRLSDIEAYVIRIDDDTVDSYAIDQTFIKRMTHPIYSDMIHSRRITTTPKRLQKG